MDWLLTISVRYGPSLGVVYEEILLHGLGPLHKGVNNPRTYMLF